MTISAKMILDSVSPQGHRLRTFQICAHRFILAEINTHGALSSNYRSSRAVPVAKLLEEVRTNPAMPVAWLKNKPGMQATEPMTDNELRDAQIAWKIAANSAADNAELLARFGLHKQWSNRPLEPFLMVHGVITGTDFNNFYALRRHPDAQPEFKALADAMWECEQASTPQWLGPNQWHLPYVTDDELFNAHDSLLTEDGNEPSCIKLSVARVARVSYKNFDGTVDIEKDLALYDQLLTSKHMSPFEHQATPDGTKWIPNPSGLTRDMVESWINSSEHGNLTGWIQYRKTIPNEWVPG